MFRFSSRALFDRLSRMPWWVALLLAALLSGSAFVTGAVTAIGFEFLPLLDKGQLIFSVGFYGSLLLFSSSIIRGISLLFYRAAFNATGLIHVIPRLVRVIIASSIVLLLWYAVCMFFIKISDINVISALSAAFLVLPILYFWMAFGSAEAFWMNDKERPSEEVLESRVSKLKEHMSALMPALIAGSAFVLGYALVDYLRVTAKPVDIEIADGRTIRLRVAMTGERGMLFFRTSFADDCSIALTRPVFIPWSEINSITGPAGGVPLLPAYLPGGNLITLLGTPVSPPKPDDQARQAPACESL
jgi:hypothetical protein